MYSGIRVIENFQEWNKLNDENIGLKTTDLNTDEPFFQNQCLVLKMPEGEYTNKTKVHAIVKGEKIVPINKPYSPLRVKSANTEQILGLELLKDDSVPLVTLLGAAGSRKDIFGVCTRTSLP